MIPENLLGIPYDLLQKLPQLYTFLLLLVRYFAMLVVTPGIGLGERGMIIRAPAAAVLAYASLVGGGNLAPIPDHWLYMLGATLFEVLFGAVLGFLPLMIVSGVQMGASIASTTMGLTAASLIDPTSGSQVPDLARVFGDLAVVVFLAVGGHYTVIYAAAGMGHAFVPGGMFSVSDTAQLLTAQCGELFKLGVMVSAPIVVALLVTQFVMGLISKAVPTVNIFIISFPLTIGIGLILSMLVLPEMVVLLRERYLGLGEILTDFVNLRG